MKLSKKVTYLGMTLDEHLDWSPQLQNLFTKLSTAVGMLSKLRYYLQYNTLISIYYALFNSHIDYCIQNLGFTNQASIEKIEKLQNKALRIIHFKGPRDTTRPLYEGSKILPIRKLLKQKHCLFAFDFFRNLLPNYFSNYLTPLGIHHNHCTRATGHSLVVVRTNRIRYGSYNIANQISKDWNELHSKIDNYNEISKGTFEKHLHSILNS